jgi:Tfp pilus assembly protein PilO
MTFDDIRNLQWDDVIQWPIKTKVIALTGLIAVMGMVFWLEFALPEMHQIQALASQTQHLKSQIRQEQRITLVLPAYQAQIKVMNRRFQQFLEQLPNRSQIPSLLDDITLAGRSRGLDFELFQPVHRIRRRFYQKIPVKLTVVGTYGQLGRFVAAVAAMSRIVVISKIHITRVPYTAKSLAVRALSKQKLTMQCTATTYRYLGSKGRDKIHA